ncbi:hypothetical protein C8Q78DRAFT_1234 [Trametes maxima]|nr:hypothetical protein C8Q78DRAFT_1234 [Trametes maxima]
MSAKACVCARAGMAVRGVDSRIKCCRTKIECPRDALNRPIIGPSRVSRSECFGCRLSLLLEPAARFAKSRAPLVAERYVLPPDITRSNASAGELNFESTSRVSNRLSQCSCGPDPEFLLGRSEHERRADLIETSCGARASTLIISEQMRSRAGYVFLLSSPKEGAGAQVDRRHDPDGLSSCAPSRFQRRVVFQYCEWFPW